MHFSQTILDNCVMQNTKRLVVLVPKPEINSLVLGRKIWDLARPRRIKVLYLHVARNLDEELRALHTMAELSAVTHDPMLQVDTQVLLNKSWPDVIKRIWTPGDLIVCFANQTINEHFLRHKPISLVLETKLHVPTFLIFTQNGHNQQNRQHI